MARLVFLLSLLVVFCATSVTMALAATVRVVPIEGPIGPATSDLVERSLADAADAGADLVILRIDTPGGLDTSMRVIIRAIIESPLPVVGHVAPAGARAASAGTFILYASHVAAMAPGTNLGAATPVPVSGGGFPGGDMPEPGGEQGEKEGDAAAPRSAGESKAVEDAAAYLRSLAELRGRDADFAEAAVREARSLTYSEALEAGVIDLVAADQAELLAAIDGREVSLERGSVVIESSDPTIEEVEPDWRYELLAIITNPNVAAILMLIGVYGIIFEFYSPGLVGPGLVGAICLLLGLYAFQVLPVSYAGLGLLLLGTILVVAEAFVPSFGALGITGVAAFVAGAILLMDTDVPGFGISPWLIGALAASTSFVFLVGLGMVLRGGERPVVTGAEAVDKGHGEVESWGDGQGRVRIDGEVWHAEGPEELPAGTRVAVKERHGLTLVVAPEGQTGDGRQSG